MKKISDMSMVMKKICLLFLSVLLTFTVAIPVNALEDDLYEDMTVISKETVEINGNIIYITKYNTPIGIRKIVSSDSSVYVYDDSDHIKGSFEYSFGNELVMPIHSLDIIKNPSETRNYDVWYDYSSKTLQITVLDSFDDMYDLAAGIVEVYSNHNYIIKLYTAYRLVYLIFNIVINYNSFYVTATKGMNSYCNYLTRERLTYQTTNGDWNYIWTVNPHTYAGVPDACRVLEETYPY